MKEYSDLFRGLGCFNKEYKIHLRENARPVAHAPRRVPQAIMKKLKMKLDELVTNGIIERANGFNEWVSHLVTVEKKDKERSLRLCLDPQELNENIIDEHAYIPTYDDVVSKLNGMKFFTVLDLKDGFWHVKLAEESRKYGTFATPFGNYRFLRMPFGIKTAPSAFQQMNYDNFGDIENVIIYFDDVLIMGRDKKEHDETLKRVLERAREKNVRFNVNKIQFSLEEVKYLGHIFSHNSVKPDPDRLLAIEQMGRPKNKKDLQTFLGVVNFMRSFISNLSEKTAPLRELLKKNTIFHWTDLHSKVVDDIKVEILKSDILVPFDPSKEIIVQCDASQNGLGCCLIQDGKPISFASRSLTKYERNYAQIEKEMLSIIFACNKFKFYTYGRTIKVVNDHKPLLGIMKKEIHKISSAELQRMKLKLLNFDIVLEHAPGKSIQLADYLSRYMMKTEENEEDKALTEAILSINVSDERKIELQKETENDEILNEIKNYCKNGWPNHKTKCPQQIRYYYKLRNDIFLEDEILFYNDRIIIPKSQRKMILEKLHSPHFGITKTLQRARNSVFWPNISNEIEQTVNQCSICQENSSKNRKEPLIPHNIPNEPFKKIGCDILEHKAKNYLVVIDFYSKWIELVKLRSKTAKDINTELLRIFASFGYPHTIIGDNMPLGSYECKQFAKENDIEIVTSSPNYPQSNGMAEKAVHICKSILKKSENEEQTLKALLAYRTTPVKHLNYSPAQLLQNRTLRTDLPMHAKHFEPKLCENVDKQLQRKQDDMKKYYDNTARNRNIDFKENQSVLFINNNKWQFGKIIQKHNTPRSFVIHSDGRNYRRNTMHIKSYNEKTNETEQKIINANTYNIPQNNQPHPKVTRSGRAY